MRYVLVVLAVLFSVPAHADFFGGLAAGIERAREARAEQRAMEIDPGYASDLRTRHLLRETQDQLEENRQLLRRLERDRWERQYGPNPRTMP